MPVATTRSSCARACSWRISIFCLSRPQPTRCGVLDDLEPLQDQASLTNTGLSTLAVLNRAQSHYRVSDAEHARQYLVERGMTLAQTVLHERRVFRRSESEGRAVPELRPRDVAGESEMLRLYREVRDAISE